MVIVNIIVILLIGFASAKDFGVRGATFAIIEEDAIKLFERKAQEMVYNGKWEKLEDSFKQIVREKILRPTPVKGITKATKTRKFFYDPSITTSSALSDQRGNVFVEKGTSKNPLDIVPFLEQLIFIDGDDKQQVKWLKEIYLTDASRKKIARVILINGSPAELGKQLNHRLYFDQQGLITRKLGILHVPAVVEQEGNKLKILELDISGVR